MPSMMMVVCSYGSLFIPHDQVPYQLSCKLCSLTMEITLVQVPGRMMLSITTTLTLVTLSNGLFNTSPRTYYLKESCRILSTRIWYDNSRLRFSAVTGHWRVAYGMFPLLCHGPCRVLRHRLLLQSAVKKCESCSCSTHLYRRKFTNKSFRTTSRPLMRLGGKHCPPRESEESSAYFGRFCRSFTRCFARPSRPPSWRMGTAKRTGPPCRGTRSQRWWRRSVR